MRVSGSHGGVSAQATLVERIGPPEVVYATEHEVADAERRAGRGGDGVLLLLGVRDESAATQEKDRADASW